MIEGIAGKQEGRIFWGGVLSIAAILISLPDLSAHHVYVGPDMIFHLTRIEGIREGLLAGQFPVRINAYQLGGYGMPTDIFYPNLFLYIPACLQLAGGSLISAWKCLLVLINFMTAYSCWWMFSAYMRSIRFGALASLFYLVFFYRITVVYSVSAVGSALGQAFLPAACLSIWMVLHRRISYWPAAVLFSTGGFQSHIISGMMLLYAVVAMVAASLPNFRFAEVRRASAKAVGFTVLLNLWFYAPLVYFHQHMDYVMKHVTYEGINHIFPFSGTDFYIGSMMLLLLVMVILYAAYHHCKLPSPFWPLTILGGLLVLLMVSPQPWEWIGRAGGFLQFTARLDVFPGFLLSLALALGMSCIPFHRILLPLACAGLCFAGNVFWLLGSPYSVPQHLRPQSEEQLWHEIFLRRMSVNRLMQNMEGDIVGTGYRDYLDQSVSNLLKDDDDMRKKVADQEVFPMERMESVERHGTTFVFQYKAGHEEWIRLPLFWYMGYAARDTRGHLFPLQGDEDGQVQVFLPAGSGSMHVSYEGVPWFHVTDLVSWFSLFVFLYVTACEQRRTYS